MKKIVAVIILFSIFGCGMDEEDTVTVIDKTDIELKNRYIANDPTLGECSFTRKGDYVIVQFTREGKTYELLYTYKETEEVTREVNQ